MMTIVFAVPGPPAPWHVHTRWSRAPSKLRLKEFQAKVKLYAEAAMAGRLPHDGPVVLDMAFFRPFPDSAPKDPGRRLKWEQKHILMVPDWDAYSKGTSDAMNGVVYLDDKQVVKAKVEKGYREGGETLITVTLL